MNASATFSSNSSRSDGRESPKLRLTRRGRIVVGAVVTMLVAALLAAAAVLGAPQAQANSVQSQPDAFGYVIVSPGDSLWSVASELDAETDPRDLVAEIVRLNALSDSGVQAGQPVAVPLRYADADGVISASELGL